MDILNERTVGMPYAEYKERLKKQKLFIKRRAVPIPAAELKRKTLNGIKRQGKKA